MMCDYCKKEIDSGYKIIEASDFSDVFVGKVFCDAVCFVNYKAPIQKQTQGKVVVCKFINVKNK